ncbi:MAG: hypothetical protein LKI42_04910 [Bacteroidales bacterium]|jgi:hypothetical protein|nr:hypothetical protein [Bacteroidales bacterium]MCI1785545.1 hypothetical protein [Bacteroidales bacterium]
MKEKTSALYSGYIIDGALQKLTPAEILIRCMTQGNKEYESDTTEYEPVADETLDPPPGIDGYEDKDIDKYLSAVRIAAKTEREFQTAFPESFTRGKIAGSLIDTIWRNGRFRLGDLAVNTCWKWNTEPVGNMAAFYASVSAASEYIDNLGIGLCSYVFEQKTEGPCFLGIETVIRKKDVTSGDYDDENGFMEQPPGTENPEIGKGRKCNGTIATGDDSSWIIYIPFDSSEYLLGGSLLAEKTVTSGDIAPEIQDTGYFCDCYEVVRELVEDGIIISGITVGDGGLITALGKMMNGKAGIRAELYDIMKANPGKDKSHILFSEIPGVIIQIKDSDYDYLDAELLLQEVAYYPLGHPEKDSKSIKAESGGNSGIIKILQSLLNGQASEGED